MAVGQQISLQVTAGALPDGYCFTTYAKLLQDYAARLIVVPDREYSTFAYGSVEPNGDQGPWFNTNLNEWWVWDQTLGRYRSERPSSITGEVSVGSVMFWDGQISQVFNYWGDRWLFANGQLISRTVYPDYFSLVGTKWNVGDGSTTFGIIDLRNYFAVGANADVAGQAQTIVSDGVTPTIQRPYTTHVHAQGDPSIVGDGKTAGNSYSSVELDTTSNAAARVATRVLPPYKALVPLVRVK